MRRLAIAPAVTRQKCLRQVAATGSLLAFRGLAPAGWLPDADGNSPVVVVTESISIDANPRARAWIYITEILHRAGIFFERMAPGQLEQLFRRGPSVVVLAGNLPLPGRQRELLTAWVQQGGSLIGIGGASGLDEIFGIKSESPLAEGWLKITAPDHPLVAGLRSSLHVFGGCAAKPASATSLASVAIGSAPTSASAILENNFGKGRAILLGPDLLFSIVHIQQGLRVLQDHQAAPDGSAIVDEGMLKAEDGLVLDWLRDRTPVRPDNGAIFLEPICDELREIILRSIFYLARRQEIALPLLWYWPRSVQAVGLISHDTDGNNPAKAVKMLETVNRLNVKSTWCTLYPGGYPERFYQRLKDEDFEIGLHFDAMNGGARTSWSRDNFLFQIQWLEKATGLDQITTNKNHYTRWEGRLDFLRWCEDAGISSDQSRGPSKKGTIGFPLGGSQPYFPLDDEAGLPRYLKVLEVNLFTQDPVVTCPPEYGRQLLDSALRHHGVGHFLFHPAHIEKPGVPEALGALVDLGRSHGMEWWTSRQIYEWEMLRRSVVAKFTPNAVHLRAGKALRQASLLVLRPGSEARTITVKGVVNQGICRNVYGFEFDAVNLDIEGSVTVKLG